MVIHRSKATPNQGSRRPYLTALVLVALTAATNPLAMDSDAAAEKNSTQAVPGDQVKIVTPDDRARLCPHVGCEGDREIDIRRLPTGTEFKVEAVQTQTLPKWDVVWYEVSHWGKKGWVSEFDTDKAPKKPRYR